MQIKSEIVVSKDITAKYGGRLRLEDDKYLHIYCIDKDVTTDENFSTSEKNTKILVPITKYKNEISYENFVSFVNEKNTNKLVLSKTIFEMFKQADDCEYYDYENKCFRILPNNNEIVEKFDLDQKEKKTMSDTTLSMIKNASIQAVKSEAAKEANAAITANVKKALKLANLQTEFFDTPVGTQLIQLLGPSLIDYIALYQEEAINSMLGKNASKRIREGCKLAMEESLKDVIGPLIKFVLPMLKDLASMGINAANSMGSVDGQLDEESELDKVFSKQKVE